MHLNTWAGGEYTPLSPSSTWALPLNLPEGSFYLFMLSFFIYIYNAAVSAPEGAKFPGSDFFADWNLRFAKAGNNIDSKQTIHELSSSLMYELMEDNTGIAIFMPNSKCSLPVAGCRFLPAFDRSSNVNKWSLVNVRHFLTRLVWVKEF